MPRYIPKHLHDAIRNAANAYAWPGGYPVYLVMKDGGTLCPSCVRSELRVILRDTHDGDRRSGWCADGADINYEDDSLHCDHCGERIESAYCE